MAASPESYILRCPQCGAKNRIPADRVNDRPKCGKCQSPLNLDSLLTDQPVLVTDKNFADEVLSSTLPVLLDCWAEWCAPCHLVGPIVEELALEWKGRVKVGKLNVDENPATASRFQIRSIPSFLIFDQGRLKDTLVGALPKAQFIQRMSPYIEP